MATHSPIVSESDILAEVIAPERGDLTVEVARSMLRWKFTDRATRRIDALAQRNSSGTITDDEREELQSYLRVGSLVNLVQAKARLSRKMSGESQP